MAKWTVRRLKEALNHFPEDAQIYLMTEFDVQHEDEMNDLGYREKYNIVVLLGHERFDHTDKPISITKTPRSN